MTSELDNRNIAVSMRKSVENLVISSQDAIGQSISQALTFSGVITQHANQMIAQEYKSSSRSPSPSLRVTDTEGADSDGKQNDFSLQVPNNASGDSISLCSQTDTTPSSINSKTLTNPGKVLEGGRTKKKSWYSGLYPTYKSRSEDFRRLFKDMPDDERLIVDYSCALQKDILAHGRLYVSQHYFCFYANIFGWETSLSLRWKDVTSITKEKTALVIPNAILVCTDNDKLFLTSFSGRDKAYLMMFRLWQNALMDQPFSSQEMWQWVRSCYGEELGFNSDDEDYTRDTEDEKIVSVLPDSSEFVMEPTSLEAAGDDLVDRTEPRPGFGRSVSQPPELTHNGVLLEDPVEKRPKSLQDNGDTIPTDASDTTDSEHDKHTIDVERCPAEHKGQQFICAEIPIAIDTLFTMIFTNSKFNLELLAARGASDYIQAAWQHDAQTGLKCRQISYTISLSSGPIGPKEVYITETQVMNKCSKPGVLYSIDATSENAGIPYAEYFSVFAHYCLTKRGDSLTHVLMHSHIQYKKSVWAMVKGFLEKNTMGGIEQFARLLESRLMQEAERAPTRKPRRRRRTQAILTESHAPLVSPPCPRPPARTTPAPAPRALGAWWWGVAILLAINALLYWRLYAVTSAVDVADLQRRMSSLSSEQMLDWSRLLDQHSQQLSKWRTALDTAVTSLRQTEQALTNLLTTIIPSIEKMKSDSESHSEL